MECDTAVCSGISIASTAKLFSDAICGTLLSSPVMRFMDSRCRHVDPD